MRAGKGSGASGQYRGFAPDGSEQPILTLAGADQGLWEFDAQGNKTKNARASVWWNGVLVHDDVELPGATGGGLGDAERATGPILLQDHGNPVRYRNIWFVKG